MAGIGFELRKLYEQGGRFSKHRAYGYAGIIYIGPMILGLLLIVSLVYLSQLAGFSNQERDSLLSMISYSILGSLAVTNFFSMIVMRYVSDMLYEDKLDRILPAYFASSVLMLVLGSIFYGGFLIFSGISFSQALLCWLLFGELCLCWNVTNFLTAIKDYKAILMAYGAAIVLILLVGGLSLYLHIPNGLLFSICVTYGALLLSLTYVLCQYFPSSKQLSFEFLNWYDRYTDLFKVGLYIFIGLFAHIIMLWYSPLGRVSIGLFRTAPAYDVPAMLAFLTTLIATVSFVVSVEVFFYPKFKEYYRLYNGNGSLLQIEQAEVEMLEVLQNQMKYLAWKQLLGTILLMFAGSTFLMYLPLGFNAQMKGYFQTLCLAYGLYAVGNSSLLILLYFADYKGAKFCARLFAGATVILTFCSLFLDRSFYGYGFLMAAALLFLSSIHRLNNFIEDLSYHVLGAQPLVYKEKVGFFGKIAGVLTRSEEV